MGKCGCNRTKWPSLNPSELRNLVDIQQQTTERDEFGAKQSTWASVGTAWASVKAIKLQEQISHEQVTAEVTDTIEMRYPAFLIAPGMRAFTNGQYFRIQALDNVEQRNIVLRLQCQQIFGVAIP